MSEYYKDNKDKLMWQCNKHGVVLLSFNKLTKSKRCPKCGLEQKAKSKMYAFDFVKKYIVNNMGYLKKSLSISRGGNIAPLVEMLEVELKIEKQLAKYAKVLKHKGIS